MDKIATRRNVVALSIALGVIAAFLVYYYIKTVGTNGEPPMRPVALARQTIPPATIIESAMIETRQMPGNQVPEDSAASEEEVVGKVALTSMEGGSPILRKNVTDRSSALGLAYTVPTGMRAVTVALDPIIGVAGFLKPGNHVDVLATFNANDGTVTKTVLQDLTLLATGSKVITSTVDTEKQKVEDMPNATLAVTPIEAEALILAESKGKLRLALRAVGDVMRVHTTGINSRNLIGFVPPDPGKQGSSGPAPSAGKTYFASAPSSAPAMNPFYSSVGPLPAPRTIDITPRTEVEVIRGSQVERVPVKT
ncbi:MAG: Flp pilus assembly protein CpaB [Armatimonadota bacterium]|nr:Flp pilus assembly protein CpaB [Armatimonadota bacterium]